MKKLDNFFGCEEISREELMTISGGESFAYWFGYVIGKGAEFIHRALENPPSHN